MVCKVPTETLFQGVGLLGAYAAGGALAGLALGGPIGAGVGAVAGMAFVATPFLVASLGSYLEKNGFCCNVEMNAFWVAGIVLAVVAVFFASVAAVWGGLLAAGIPITFLATLAFCGTAIPMSVGTGLIAALLVLPPLYCCGVIEFNGGLRWRA